MEQTILIPAGQIQNVFGSFDENIKLLEKNCQCSIMNRGDGIRISGEDEDVEHCVSVLKSLIKIAGMGETISTQHVNYLLNLSQEDRQRDVSELMSDVVCFTKAGKPIRPKSFGQKR